MKIHYTESKEAFISSSEINRITISKLETMLKGGQFLRSKDGETWVAKDEDNWRHGSVSEEYMRPATDLDLALFTVLSVLRNEKL
jgi:hypothetical protein